MKIVLALACLVVFGLALPLSDDNLAEWENYKTKFGKTYESKEHEAVRRNIYFMAKEKVMEHNARFEQGLTSYELGLNSYSDMLSEEFRKIMNGHQIVESNSYAAYVHVASNSTLPSSVDWRNEGAVTNVKNQGHCGSCWAFSAVGSIEGQYALRKGKLVSLSEQQLVDCSGSFGNRGCTCGKVNSAFDYIIFNGGIDTERSYRYTAKEGTCTSDKTFVGATVTGYVDIERGNESALLDAVATVGPISVTIDARGEDFQHYKRGTYDYYNCSSSTHDLDHSVLVVGYGTENGTPYWLVKNSWGKHWGDHGYIKMIRNKDNHCGIATQASYPLV